MAQRTYFPGAQPCPQRSRSTLPACRLILLFVPLLSTPTSDWVWDSTADAPEPYLFQSLLWTWGLCFPKAKKVSFLTSIFTTYSSVWWREPSGSYLSSPRGMAQVGQSGALRHSSSTEPRESKLLTLPRKSKTRASVASCGSKGTRFLF